MGTERPNKYVIQLAIPVAKWKSLGWCLTFLPPRKPTKRCGKLRHLQFIFSGGSHGCCRSFCLPQTKTKLHRPVANYKVTVYRHKLAINWMEFGCCRYHSVEVIIQLRYPGGSNPNYPIFGRWMVQSRDVFVGVLSMFQPDPIAKPWSLSVQTDVYWASIALNILESEGLSLLFVDENARPLVDARIARLRAVKLLAHIDPESLGFSVRYSLPLADLTGFVSILRSVLTIAPEVFPGAVKAAAIRRVPISSMADVAMLSQISTKVSRKSRIALAACWFNPNLFVG